MVGKATIGFPTDTHADCASQTQTNIPSYGLEAFEMETRPLLKNVTFFTFTFYR